MWWLKEDFILIKKNINCKDFKEIIDYYKEKNSDDLSILNKLFDNKCSNYNKIKSNLNKSVEELNKLKLIDELSSNNKK